MPLLKDSSITRRILRAYTENQWADEILWSIKALEEMCRDLPIKNITPSFAKHIDEIVRLHVEAKGDINWVKETDPIWENERFYEFRVKVDGVEVYVKAVFEDEYEDDSPMHVVSCHHGWR